MIDDPMFLDMVEQQREEYQRHMDAPEPADPAAYAWSEWAEQWADIKQQEESDASHD